VIALVTGGNRGIGKAICEQLADAGMDVVLGSRDLEKGREAAVDLEAPGRSLRVEQIDVADPASVEACAERLGSVDVLVNNAGIFESAVDPLDPLSLDDALLGRNIKVNFEGPRRTMACFVPTMAENGYGRVVNVSSAAGTFAAMPSGCGAAYCLSKSALNALTKLTAESVDPSEVKVNAMCPGFVRTDMGLATGGNPTVLPAEAAETAVWLATLAEDGPSGEIFREREVIRW
jgi:NAD(P)-dependent dehydrogenase (short-subunit alcohol dehydrogenase family)